MSCGTAANGRVSEWQDRSELDAVAGAGADADAGPRWADYSRAVLLAVWCAVLTGRTVSKYGEGGNESERVWWTRRRTSSPSQSRSEVSFFLSLSRSSACPSTPVSRSFPPHFLSRSFLSLGKAQSRSRSRAGALCLASSLPFLVFFGRHRYCCHPCCSSSSALLSASWCVPSAFVLIAVVISGWTHSAMCAMLPITCYGRTARQSWVGPLSKLSLDGSLHCCGRPPRLGIVDICLPCIELLWFVVIMQHTRPIVVLGAHG